MMKSAASLLALLILFYAAACAYMYVNQQALLYFPTPPSAAPDAQALLFKNDDETLRLWHAGADNQRALIYFGGNAEDVAQNLPVFRQIFPEHALYLVNYRGYGGSTGTPSEAGLLRDALAIYDFVRSRHVEVSVIGRSLGSGVAVYLGSERTLHKLALVTPYDSMARVAKRHYPLLPIGLLLKDQYHSMRRAAAIAAPTLILAAEHDAIIPTTHAEALAAAFPPAQVQMKVVPDATHNTIGASEFYLTQLREFF